MQSACEGCHAEALDAARDSHPESKFTDPRNADRVALLDARYCVTCHVEHRPERTRAMGVTIPDDYCGICHVDIAAERPTHAGMEFATCASAGCHNFHDNRSLYEDFLLKHANEPALLAKAVVPERNFANVAGHFDAYPKKDFPLVALSAADADSPAAAAISGEASGARAQWSTTAHAASGVNCTACHTTNAGVWADRPGYARCGDCHGREQGGFLEGRHGMRLDTDALGVALAPMRPEAARLPMKAETIADELDCGSCHPAHSFDTAFAAVDACLGCHDDSHSKAYVESPHYGLLERARGGALAAEAAVTCSTCHMPRVEQSYDWGAYVHVLVQHNQSDNFRPNEKMIRTVCERCHGLGFSIDALADRALIANNFNGLPNEHVRSIDLAAERRREIERQRATDAAERGANERIPP
jgi:hypothetical protein